MDDKESSINTKERSSAYPSLDLQKAIVLAEHARKALGRGQHDRITLAKALGYNGLNGASTRAVASLVHYGLLDRRGDKYSQSPLADRVINFIDNSEKEQAIIEAAKTPKLFNELFNQYNGEPLPTKLDSILSRNFGISEKSANDAAKTFRQTMEFSGLLKEGKLVEVGAKNEDSFSSNPSDQSFATQETPTEVLRTEGQTINLPSGVRVIFPSEFGYLLAIGKFAQPLQDLEKQIQLTKSEGSGGGDESAEVSQ